MGLAAVALYPLQAYFIPKLQRQVNLLGFARVREVRSLSQRIGEVTSVIEDVHANYADQAQLTTFGRHLDRIFRIRYDIYRKKFFIKFLNNFIAQLTPFFFLSIGGYLVLRGSLTLGSLVGVLAAYKDLAPPWKELLDFYQIQQDAKIKYAQLRAQFDPPGLRPPLDAEAPGDEDFVLEGAVEAEELGARRRRGRAARPGVARGARRAARGAADRRRGTAGQRCSECSLGWPSRPAVDCCWTGKSSVRSPAPAMPARWS